MNRTVYPYTTESDWLARRATDLTSTEIAALFGVSPYMTLFDLWHRKRGSITVTYEGNERTTWGNRLQDAIAAGIAEDKGWTIRRMDEYIRLPDERIGSSFDYMATDESGEFLLEIKNVDGLIYRDQWLNIDGEIEAPAHIELQLQHQMLVAGASRGVIGALSGGNKSTLLMREADPRVHTLIRRKAADFWQSIADGREPPPQFPADADVVTKLFGFAEPGRLLNKDADADFTAWCEEYSQLGKQIKDLEAQRDTLKANMLMAIGDAEKVIAGRYTLTAGMVAATHIEYDRNAYRAFRITSKKEKAK